MRTHSGLIVFLIFLTTSILYSRDKIGYTGVIKGLKDVKMLQLGKAQHHVLQKLYAQDPQLKSIFSYRSQIPVYISGKLSPKDPRDHQLIAKAFLKSIGPLIRINQTVVDHHLKLDTFKSKFSFDDRGHSFIKYRQYFQGLPVYKRSIKMTVNGEGEVVSVATDIIPAIYSGSIQTTPNMTAKEARQIALDDLAIKALPDREQPIELSILPQGEKAYLAYSYYFRIGLKGYAYFIDAVSGRVIKNYLLGNNCTNTTGTGITAYNKAVAELKGTTPASVIIDTCESSWDDTWFLEDHSRDSDGPVIETYNLSNCTEDQVDWGYSSSCWPRNAWTDSNNVWDSATDYAKVEAHYNTGRVQDFYKEMFSRNGALSGLTGGWADIDVGVDIKDYDNAMAMGGISTLFFGPASQYALAYTELGIVGHEFTHIVVYDETGWDLHLWDFEVDDFSGYDRGAMNEHYADVFGNLAVYYHDEPFPTYYKTYYPSSSAVHWLHNSFRYVKLNYYKTKLEDFYVGRSAIVSAKPHLACKYIGSEDDGGVHDNAEVLTKAAYLIAQGGKNKQIEATDFTCKDPNSIQVLMKNYPDTIKTWLGLATYNQWATMLNRIPDDAKINIRGIGETALGLIWYRTLTQKIILDETWDGYVQKTLDSCAELFGSDDWRCNSVRNGFAAIGLTECLSDCGTEGTTDASGIDPDQEETADETDPDEDIDADYAADDGTGADDTNSGDNAAAQNNANSETANGNANNADSSESLGPEDPESLNSCSTVGFSGNSSAESLIATLLIIFFIWLIRRQRKDA